MDRFLEQFVIQMANPGHAYLLRNISVAQKESVFNFFYKNWTINTKNNSDFLTFDVPVLKIEHSREISNSLLRGRMNENTRRIIWIEFDSITAEAQNALLKSIEEPSEASILFLVASRSTNLLATITSRVIEIVGDRDSVYTELCGEFLTANYTGREKIIHEYFLADTKKNKPANRTGAKIFCADLEKTLYVAKDRIHNFPELYKKVTNTSQYIGDGSSNIKYILEYLALVIPAIE